MFVFCWIIIYPPTRKIHQVDPPSASLAEAKPVKHHSLLFQNPLHRDVPKF